MSNKSNNQGRAYEFICLLSLYEAIKQIRNANIIENSSYEAAHKAWNTLKPSEQALYTLSAKSTIAGIFSLEPIIPPSVNIPVPIMCPSKITISPILKPRGAISPPVKISAIETAAPNHKNRKVQKPNFSFSLIIFYTRFLI